MKLINWDVGLNTQDCGIFGHSLMIRILEAVV
jgi:hypothetical protein